MNRKNTRGFTLVELMVALVLGLILTGAVISAFLANRRVYATSESLGRVQENARAAFELMSRDAREAGAIACNSKLVKEPGKVVNVVNNFAANPFANFANGLDGADAVVTGLQRDSVVLKSAAEGSVSVDTSKANLSWAQIGLADPIIGLAAGDVMVACDPEHAAVFQVAALGATDRITVAALTGPAPQNSRICLLSDPNACGDASIIAINETRRYVFGCQRGDAQITSVTLPLVGTITLFNECTNGLAPASVAKLKSINWFVGDNGRGGSSLFRRIDGRSPVVNDEIAEGVTGMQLTYLFGNNTDYVDANAVTTATAWDEVRAMRIELQFQGGDPGAVADTGGTGTLQRTVAYTVALRNRING